MGGRGPGDRRHQLRLPGTDPHLPGTRCRCQLLNIDRFDITAHPPSTDLAVALVDEIETIAVGACCATTGTVLSPQRRTAVLGIARAAGAFVVEDDFARRLAHADSPPLPLPLAADDPDGIVVHVRSLTKAAASPSLRIGALSARGPVLERLRAIQVVDSLFVPRPLQETALELVGSPPGPATCWRSPALCATAGPPCSPR
jgi:histidinol-phosphate/aromatic aminotransferase/cobyric acid decarboxylase-like protein